MIPHPLADLFEPAHELIVDLARGTIVTGEAPADRSADDGPSLRPPDRRSAGPPRLLHRSFDQPAFESAVRRIQDHIAAGDVYQVNLSVAERFSVPASPWEVYLRLREINPSPWMGFADFGDWQLVSGSPELLVEVGGTDERRNGGTAVRRNDGTAERRNDGAGVWFAGPRLDRAVGGPTLATVVPPFRRSAVPPFIRTRPIAGTRKKTGDSARDAAMRSELRLDQKEQAEHRMLLDLARNDLGRVCQFGSVTVAEREVIEEYSHVFHLVSEVVGRLRSGVDAWEVVRAIRAAPSPALPRSARWR
jgi:anthranilate/para-aminobenzoate synthase component I